MIPVSRLIYDALPDFWKPLYFPVSPIRKN